MINISQSGRQYIIEGSDGKGTPVLSQPLHRLFLRSHVNASLGSSPYSWEIPFGEQPDIPLRKVVAHLQKYGISFLLDQRCEEVLSAVRIKREEFERICKDGRIAKLSIADSVYRRITSQLSTGFRRPLTKLQITAVHHLLTVKNGANFSVPGSGKTSVALAYFHLLKNAHQIDAFLVVGPASCFEPWEHEYKICFGKDPKAVRLAGHSKARRRELCLLAERYELLLTTYHSAARDIEELGRVMSRRRYLLILDESHYVKRPEGGMLADAVLELAEYASRRVILTGTPMPNGLPDLWSQFTFLWFNQKPLGNADEYLSEVRQTNTAKAMASVKRKISPLFYRTTKSQLGLPRPSFRTVQCEMSPLQGRIYRGIAAKFLARINEKPTDRMALREWRKARSVRLLQVASNPALLSQRCDEFELPPMDLQNVELREAIDHYAKYESPNKINAATRIAREICGRGEKVIIWSTFVHNLKMVAKTLEQLNPVIVHGGVPYLASLDEDFSRETLISKFRDDPQCLVLIANPAACAESISLHRSCHHAIYFDRSFNCAHYLQSLDRIHRLGLPSNQKTYYYLLQSTGTIDAVVDSRLREKMRLMRDVIEADLPGAVPGYWSEDLGDEETIDHQQVEAHIKSLFKAK